jgi:hypothetical protein
MNHVKSSNNLKSQMFHAIIQASYPSWLHNPIRCVSNHINKIQRGFRIQRRYKFLYTTNLNLKML